MRGFKGGFRVVERLGAQTIGGAVRIRLRGVGVVFGFQTEAVGVAEVLLIVVVILDKTKLDPLGRVMFG